MAYQSIFQDIQVQDEVSFGSSIATAHRLHITETSLNLTREKNLIEDTSSFIRGRDRMGYWKDTLDGDISGYATPRNLHYMFEWVNGTKGVSSAGGSNACVRTYPQQVGSSWLSRSVNIDRNNTQERYNGVVAKSLEISGSDGLIEFTLGCIAQSRADGVSLSYSIGETIDPFAFSDVNITIHQGATYGAQGVTIATSEWNVKYDNGLEGSYLSGNAAIVRVDAKIPTVEGKFKIFHDGSSWTSATYGCSEFYLRIDGTLPSCRGLIAGTSAYKFRIDVPRAEFTSTVRNYEQSAFAVEEIEFKGLLDLSPNGTSSLWVPSITAGLTL